MTPVWLAVLLSPLLFEATKHGSTVGALVLIAGAFVGGLVMRGLQG